MTDITAKYGETTVTGAVVKRLRADTVTLYNPLNGTPRVEFFEQQVTTLPDGTVYIDPTETLFLTVADMNMVVPILDLVTLKPTGQTFTAGQMALMLTSLYVQQGQLRDAAKTH